MQCMVNVENVITKVLWTVKDPEVRSFLVKNANADLIIYIWQL